MRKWGIGVWLLVGLFAAATGLLGTWLFRERMQYGFSQLLGVGISGTTLGFFTAFRAETIRWQDNHMRQIENTSKVLDYYNGELRDRMTSFVSGFDRSTANQMKQSLSRANQSVVVRLFEFNAVQIHQLATIMHLLDKLAWMMQQGSYADQKEIFSAVRSEVRRFLFDPRFQLIVDTLRRDSSLTNLNWLYRQLKEDGPHGH